MSANTYKQRCKIEWPVFPACFFELTRASLARGRCACAGNKRRGEAQLRPGLTQMPASQSLGLFFAITASPYCHPGPCGLKVHHVIRDPHAAGPSAQPSRFSQTVIPDALQHAVVLRRAGIHAPLDPRHKAEGDIEENLQHPTASLLPPAAAQDFASSKIASA